MSMNNIAEITDFTILRYANCWEDAEILLKGLRPFEGSKILSVASAGDNSFSLLTTNPAQVIAVDISKTQLALVSLKKVAMQQLTYEELLGFLGFHPSSNRIEILQRLQPYLPPDVFDHWNTQQREIHLGIISQGKFERYFQLFSDKILPWIHNKRMIDRLLTEKSAIDQENFYHQSWNTWRWRLFFKLFFSKVMMGRFGRDPAFLREVTVPVGRTIFARAACQLKSVAAQHNSMLRYQLTGNFSNCLPHYLHPANYGKVKSNLDRLHLYEGVAEEAIKEYGMVDFMNLSNIFEYMDHKTFKDVATKLTDGLHYGGRIAYWNLLVPRKIAGLLSGKFRYLQELSDLLTRTDNGFFYERFIVDEKYG